MAQISSSPNARTDSARRHFFAHRANGSDPGVLSRKGDLAGGAFADLSAVAGEPAVASAIFALAGAGRTPFLVLDQTAKLGTACAVRIWLFPADAVAVFGRGADQFYVYHLGDGSLSLYSDPGPHRACRGSSGTGGTAHAAAGALWWNRPDRGHSGGDDRGKPGLRGEIRRVGSSLDLHTQSLSERAHRP